VQIEISRRVKALLDRSINPCFQPDRFHDRYNPAP
jgi:hypothetical protein